MIVEPETRIVPNVQLGDMTVVGRYPMKMVKALAAIASELHQTYDAQPGAMPGGSKEACLFSSLAVRDFLVGIGYEDATVRACSLYVCANDRNDKQIWSLAIGHPGDPDIEDKFNGHAVCTVPSLSLLIDCTLYQVIRPAWDGAITGMMAHPYTETRPETIWKLRPIAWSELDRPDRSIYIGWLDRPDLQWKRAIDFRIKNQRRRAVKSALVDAFGKWTE